MASSPEKFILTPVVKRLGSEALTPLEAYTRIALGKPYSFLLESAEGFSTVARYSFIGGGPKFVLACRGSSASVVDDRGTRSLSGEPFDFLGSHFDNFEIKTGASLPPFLGGAVGYMGFDCVGWFEHTLFSDGAEAVLMFFDSVVIFDHASSEILVVTLTSDHKDFHDPSSGRMENERIASLLTETTTFPLDSDPIQESASISSNFSRQGFERSVDEIKHLIEKGDCYQVVLSQRFRRRTTAKPTEIYRSLRLMNPSPYMFLLQMEGRSMVGSSPETLVTVRGNDLCYRPIAGTRPRGNDANGDARLADEMRADPKEVAEHMMLVDMGRNDLGRVAEFGSVKVARVMGVEKFSHVQHLVSDLSAKMETGLDRFDVLSSCFPAGTVTGAPKVKAVEIIRKLEPEPRGFYAGAVGYFDYAGDMDTCIAIRTIELKDGVAEIQAGAGVVADSVAASEYEETVNKAKAMFKAIDIAEGR